MSDTYQLEDQYGTYFITPTVKSDTMEFLSRVHPEMATPPQRSQKDFAELEKFLL